MVEVVIEKRFTGAYRALEKEAGGLRIRIYSGNNSIKARYLIRI